MGSLTATILLSGLLAVVVSAELEIVPFIIKGDDTGRKQFPYIARVAILPANESESVKYCGGSIISKNWVITAAHCIDLVTHGVDIITGVWNRTDPNEKQHQTIFVPRSDIIVHEGWTPDTIQNDLALVRLPKPLKTSSFTKIIKLPSMKPPYQSYVGQTGIAAGWGRINIENNDRPDILRWMEAPVIENSVCFKSYPLYVRDPVICIRSTKGQVGCFGDSGGPLALAGKDPTLIGVYSFGSDTCEIGTPDAFTRITAYLDWIKKHTGIAY